MPGCIEGSSLGAVQRVRSACLRVALLVAVAVQTVYATPASSTAQLRAAYCCATRCHRQGTLRSDKCCGVTSQANDAALLASRVRLYPALAVHSLPPSPPGLDLISSASLAAPVELGGHDPPLFLKVRTLRL